MQGLFFLILFIIIVGQVHIVLLEVLLYSINLYNTKYQKRKKGEEFNTSMRCVYNIYVLDYTIKNIYKNSCYKN